MPNVYPFCAIQYHAGLGDLSKLVAPPYDVLDGDGKAQRLTLSSENIVAVDLPHVPAKQLGPDAAYEGAAATLERLLQAGTLERRGTPSMFAYRQTFEFGGQTHQRSGMACTVDAVDFGPREGGGILPHEQTFGGPKADRMALMKATRCQLSPIFGLHPDESGRATACLHEIMASRPADASADLGDGVRHEIWAVDADSAISSYQNALAGEDVFIADGHHRYNTQLDYIRSLQNGSPVPEDHPARRCMMVLIGMNDPGLVIGPTHRVLGGMSHYTMDRFIESSAGYLQIEAIDNEPHRFNEQIVSIAEREHTNAFGLYDFATGLCFAGWPASGDPLSDDFPDRHPSWRGLDVALIQHLIVEQICQPELNDGEPIKWAFPHSVDEVLAIGRGEETGSAIEGGGKPQLAVIVRPTPLEAVREVSRAGELMPQKSTFFYPKLATGLFLNPLDRAT